MTPERLTLLIETARQVDPLTTAHRSRMRRSLMARVSGRPWHQRRLVLTATFAACVALGVIGTQHVFSRTAAARGPQLELSAGARHGAVSDEGIELHEGSLTLKTASVFSVRTPQLEVVINRGRAAFHVVGNATSVELLEGEGVARGGERSVSLRVGERVDSKDTRFAPRVMLPTPPVDARCNGATACLEEVAQNDDLSAQTALVRLGLNALADGHFEQAARVSASALTRFPQGVLEPEMHLVRLQALARLGHDAEAREEGRWYLEHAMTAPAAPGVSLLMGDLAMRTGAFEAAREAYAKTLTLEPGDLLAAEAWYGVGLAQRAMGREREASDAFRRAGRVP